MCKRTNDRTFARDILISATVSDCVRPCAIERAQPCVTMCDRGQLPEWPTVKILELLLSKVGIDLHIYIYLDLIPLCIMQCSLF